MRRAALRRPFLGVAGGLNVQHAATAGHAGHGVGDDRHVIPQNTLRIWHHCRNGVLVILLGLGRSMAMAARVKLTMNAWMHELYVGLGVFMPLIVSNCGAGSGHPSHGRCSDPFGDPLRAR